MTATATIQQEQSWGQFVLRVTGWVFLAMGVVALFVPLVPSIPFLLVSALAFTKA